MATVEDRTGDQAQNPSRRKSGTSAYAIFFTNTLVWNINGSRPFLHIVSFFRCYNCGEFANHLASQCNKGPMPKRCHNCKAEEHLIEDCPTLPPEKQRMNGNGKKAAAVTNGNSSPPAATNGDKLVRSAKKE